MTRRRFQLLTEGVWVATSEMYRTNTTLLVAGNRGLIVDPCLLPGELLDLAADIEDMGVVLEAGFATHAHWDHVLWARALGDVPRFASARTVEVATEFRTPMIEEQLEQAGHRWYASWERDLVARLQPVAGDTLTWSGGTLHLLVHNAHVPGHTALHDQERGLLVAADMVSDIELPSPDFGFPDPISGYLAGLELLASVSPVEHFIPGHGSPGDAREFQRRLAGDRRYLERLVANLPADDPRIEASPVNADLYEAGAEALGQADGAAGTSLA